jgi:hypothetical protein
MARPATIAEVAQLALSRSKAFDLATREFLDAWHDMSAATRKAALAEEPLPVGRVHDAYLAALAEHLALSQRMDIPSWTAGTRRFLTEPFFAGGLESLKATLIVESPLAFRRRLIFISANALSRPRGEFV